MKKINCNKYYILSIAVNVCTCVSGNDRQHITFVACGNVAGIDISPMVIYTGKYVQTPHTFNGPPNTRYATELIHVWLEHFNK